MKTCEEKTKAVFTRIEEQKEIKRARGRKIALIALPALCLCLAAAVGIGAFTANAPQKPENAAQTLDPAGTAAPAETGKTPGETGGETAAETAAPAPQNGDRLAVNKLDKTPAAGLMNIFLSGDDFVEMSDAELNAYYGENVFPTVPADLKREKTELEGGIYRRNGGNGEVYYDTTTQNYSNEDGSRCLTVAANKGGPPFQFFAVDSPDLEKSSVGGVEVTVGYDLITENYFIGFTLSGAGFSLTSRGLSEEEIVSVIRSLAE